VSVAMTSFCDGAAGVMGRLGVLSDVIAVRDDVSHVYEPTSDLVFTAVAHLLTTYCQYDAAPPRHCWQTRLISISLDGRRRMYLARRPQAHRSVHRESKKQDTKLLPITSPDVNRFSKFFH